MKNFYSSLTAVIMLYLPYMWCHLRKEATASYGLEWHISREALVYTLFLSFAILLLLTPAALFWPGVDLPFRRTGKEVFNLLAAGLAAAIIEETFFRGWLETLFKRKTGLFPAVLLVNILFAASHLVLTKNYWLSATFFPGLVMSFLKEKYNNVLPAMLFHFLGNVWAIWFFPL